MDKKENQKNRLNPLVDALDLFNTTVSDLGFSYNDLKIRIEELNLHITEKNKKLEENLYKVNQLRWFFDSILNSMTDGVIVINIEGNIALFNKGAERLTGYQSKEVVGLPYVQIFGKNVSERFTPLYTLEHGKPLYLEEKQMPSKTGTPCPVRYSTALVRENNNEILGALEVFSDLSRIKQLEKEMTNIKTQAALNQMAALVAHEVRNPLGGIRGYVDLIAESFDADDKRNEMIEHIQKSIVRLDEIVANFQLFTRPVKPYFQELDFRSYLHDVVLFFEQQENLAKRNIELVVKLGDERIIEANMDPILVEQAILAVLDNAAKAVKKGGIIAVELCEVGSYRSSKKGNIKIMIRDSGEGISSEVISELFTPFFTTREKGLGLGLALAKNFISLHHGDIKVESESGMGTTVTILIPQG